MTVILKEIMTEIAMVKVKGIATGRRMEKEKG